MDSDYLFGNFLQLSTFRSTDNKANLNRRVGPILKRLFSLAVLQIHYLLFKKLEGDNVLKRSEARYQDAEVPHVVRLGHDQQKC